MGRENNFLLGNGERLTGSVRILFGGGPKNPPYSFAEAKKRVKDQLGVVAKYLDALPLSACPEDQAVASIVLHPRYTSKSDYPTKLFNSLGLRAVGSRRRAVRPEQWGVKRHPEEVQTEVILAAARREIFHNWAATVGDWIESQGSAKELLQIEAVLPYTPQEKIKSLPEEDGAWLEVVLHNSSLPNVLTMFEGFAKGLGAEVLVQRHRTVGGLTFVPIRLPKHRVEALAGFSLVRVVRGMPNLRPFVPTMLRKVNGFSVSLPDEDALDDTCTVTIFDGGLPKNHRLSRWVDVIEPAGIGPAVAGFEAHGLAVTSAFLFGPLRPGNVADRPHSRVRHVRVLDSTSGTSGNLSCLDVLDRIIHQIDQQPTKFVNLSVGPDLPVEDDEVTEWTAALDERLAHGSAVVTVAAGNGGERDALLGHNRVQAPADAVNVLSVGAADCSEATWERAAYSCVGPGRCPGVFKPDTLAFGGSEAEPFWTIGANGSDQAIPERGTSFAAPFALRTAVGCGIQLGDAVRPLGVRALLIHTAETGSRSQLEVGWGRVAHDPSRLITCEDHEAVVLFQGELPVGIHLRAPLPLPPSGLQGMIEVSATLVIAPEVDPEQAGAYTRSGLEVAFRPHGEKFAKRGGKKSQHAKPVSFFSHRNLFRILGYAPPEDAHKWEPCLRHRRSFRSSSLKDACFDIYYHHRQGGNRVSNPTPIPYSLVVEISAPRVPDFYEQVVRAYSHVLVPLRPRIAIPVRT